MDAGKQPEKKKFNAYLKYSGLAFQLAAVVVIGLFVGRWIDAYFSLSKPIFSMILILVFFSLYMYRLYVDLTKKP